MKQNSLLSRPIRKHLGIISQRPHSCPSPHSLFQRSTASKPRQHPRPSYVLVSKPQTFSRLCSLDFAFGAFGTVAPSVCCVFLLVSGVSVVEAASRGVAQAAGRQSQLQRRDRFSSATGVVGVLKVRHRIWILQARGSSLVRNGKRLTALQCQ